MVNVNALKGKIIEKGYTVESLAQELGVDRATLYRRLSKEGESFTIKEADSIVRILELGKEEANNIFFNQFDA